MSTRESRVVADLPPYEPPPSWLPPEKRQNNPDYDNDLRYFQARTVYLRRNAVNDPLGFNVRGGINHYAGMYISKVMPNSEAHHLGLQEGDQILTVNGINFENIHHEEAVQLLKSSQQVHMTVRFFPYGYRKSYDGDPEYAQQTNRRS